MAATEDQAWRVAAKFDPRVAAAMQELLVGVSDAASAARIQSFIVSGDLSGLWGYLGRNTASVAVDAGVMDILRETYIAAAAGAEADINAAMSSQGSSAARQIPFDPDSPAGVVLAGGQRGGFSFNPTNPASLAATRSWQGNLIQEMAATQRETTMAVIREGITQGHNPRTTARSIKENLGLTQRQARAVMNFGNDLTRIETGGVRSLEAWGIHRPSDEARNLYARQYESWLDGKRKHKPNLPMVRSRIDRAPGGAQVYKPSIVDGVDTGPQDGITRWRLRRKDLAYEKKLSEAVYNPIKAEREAAQNWIGKNRPAMQGQYRDNYIKHRSEMIARTETMRAVNLGSYESWRQSVESSDLFRPDEVRRYWITARDERVRADHRTAGRTYGRGGGSVGLNEPFKVGGEYVQIPPHGVACRCAVTYDVDLSR